MLKAIVLARARRGRRDERLLLLTLLEVRAYLSPRTARRRSPPLQQKRSRGRNYSSTSLQRQTRPKTGGQRYKASSPSPITTLRSSRRRRGHGKLARHELMATRPPGVQPPCTPRRGSRRRHPAGLTSTTTLRRRRIRGLVGTSARSSTTGDKKTLGQQSSAAEKPDDNQTRELGTLSTRARPVNQATCRTRQVALRLPVSCGVSSGPA